MSNGNFIENVLLRFDQVQDQLLFKDNTDKEMLFSEPIVEFTIDGDIFRGGYVPIDGAKPSVFYEVLEDGKTQLLKRTSKKIFEETPYSSATKVKTISSTETYYLLPNGGTQLVKVKKDKKSLLDAMGNKKSELDQFIKDQRLNLRNDSDMAKLVAYYNSL